MMAMIGKMKTIDQSKSIRAICHHLNGFHAAEYIKAKNQRFQISKRNR
jgi:hypothetical protein